MRVHGRRGRLYVAIASGGTAEPLAYCNKWDISFAGDKVDVTVRGDPHKMYVLARPEVTGRFEGFYDTASAQTYTAASDGVSRRFYLYPTTPSVDGPYWYGLGVFDFTVTADVGDSVKFNGKWAAASDISYFEPPAILTESSETLLAENGDTLVVEAA